MITFADLRLLKRLVVGRRAAERRRDQLAALLEGYERITVEVPR